LSITQASTLLSGNYSPQKVFLNSLSAAALAYTP
jgi:hypothetical protein